MILISEFLYAKEGVPWIKRLTYNLKSLLINLKINFNNSIGMGYKQVETIILFGLFLKIITNLKPL